MWCLWVEAVDGDMVDSGLWYARVVAAGKVEAITSTGQLADKPRALGATN